MKIGVVDQLMSGWILVILGCWVVSGKLEVIVSDLVVVRDG